jgi:hypothetical protein
MAPGAMSWLSSGCSPLLPCDRNEPFGLYLPIQAGLLSSSWSGRLLRKQSASGPAATFTTSAAPRSPTSKQSQSSTSSPALATSRPPVLALAVGRPRISLCPYLPEEMHWFCKPDPARRTQHLHLVPLGSQRYRDELEFRDRLRGDAQIAGRYASLKRELAERYRDDREACTDAKSAFFLAVLGERNASGPVGTTVTELNDKLKGSCRRGQFGM